MVEPNADKRPGTSNCGEFVPDHPPDRGGRRGRDEALHHCKRLFDHIYHVVVRYLRGLIQAKANRTQDCVQKSEIHLGTVATVCLLRVCFLPYRHSTIRFRI